MIRKMFFAGVGALCLIGAATAAQGICDGGAEDRLVTTFLACSLVVAGGCNLALALLEVGNDSDDW